MGFWNCNNPHVSMPEAFVPATASLLFWTILLVPGQRGGWLQTLSRQCVKCALALQSNFCYSGKVRIEGKVFHTILFKDLQQRGLLCSVRSLESWLAEWLWTRPWTVSDSPSQEGCCPGIFHGALPDPLMKKMLLWASFSISEYVPWVGHVQHTAGSDPSGYI